MKLGILRVEVIELEDEVVEVEVDKVEVDVTKIILKRAQIKPGSRIGMVEVK